MSDELNDAVNQLLHQIAIGDFTDSNGHSAKMLKPVHDLTRMLSAQPRQPRQPLSEWIACSDRLPEPEVDVLCCGPNRMDSELPWVMFVDWFGSKPDCGRGVTHWQPLPAAPSSAQSLGESRE